MGCQCWEWEIDCGQVGVLLHQRVSALSTLSAEQAPSGGTNQSWLVAGDL